MGFGEADSICNPCQQRMQKDLPAVAEVQGLGMCSQQSCSCRWDAICRCDALFKTEL